MKLRPSGRRRVLATALFLGAAVAALAFAGLASAATVTVRPSTPGWYVIDDQGNGNGTVSFVNGPGTPPIGSGSARYQLATSGAGWILFGGNSYAGTPLSAITMLSYDTYRSSFDAGNNLAVALQIPVDYDTTDISTGFQGRIVFEPYNTFGGGVPSGTWQHWNTLTGKWWQSGNAIVGNANVGKFCPIASPCTWAALTAHYPNLAIRNAADGGFVLKAGSGWASFDGNADNLTVDTGSGPTTYDFEPEVPCTTVCYVDAVNGNDAFGGSAPGSAKKTIQAAINQVSPGGSVEVLPGSYNESPSITKSLTLESTAGAASTTIALQMGPTYLGALEIGGQNVTVTGFTIRGRDGTPSTIAASNVFVDSGLTSVSLTNNVLQVGLPDPASSTGDDGFGFITTYTETTPLGTLTVANNTITPLNAAGGRAFYVNLGTTQFNFTGNQVTGKFVKRGITEANDAQITGNTIDGQGLGGNGLGTFGDLDAAVYGHATITGNTFTGLNLALSVIESNDVFVNHNTFTNNGTAVVVQDGFGVPSFDPGTVVVARNAITSSTVHGIDNQAATPGTVDGTCNWWGTAAGPGPTSLNGDVVGVPFLQTSNLDGACTGGTARGYKYAALAELAASLPSGKADTDKKINEAIKFINQSLNRPNWVDDNHITSYKIFDDEKNAVKQLMAIKNPSAGVTQAISDILAGDRLLAQTAINEAIAANGKPDKITAAQKEMQRAQDEIDHGHYDAAIDHFKNAWKNAVAA